MTKTVLMETEWVLRGAYSFRREQINGALRRLLGLPSLDVEDRPAVLLALDWYAQGMDFADALHLASARQASAIATFDRKLGRIARRLRARPTVCSRIRGERSRRFP